MNLLAFVLLACSMLSCFIYKRWWVWGLFLTASLLVALIMRILGWWGLLPIGICAGCYYLLSTPLDGWGRGLISLFAVLVSGLLFFHALPSFHTWFVPPKAVGFFNYDKAFAGFFILTFFCDKGSPFRAYVASIPLILGALLLFFGTAYLLRYVKFAPHIPPYFPLWAFRTLFFVCIPEELFFRCFLQKEIAKNITHRWGTAAGIVLAALTFTVIHVQMSWNPLYLCMVFITGVIYGIVYQINKTPQSAILTHFFTNVVQMTVFVS